MDNLNEETLASLKIGETLLLNGQFIRNADEFYVGPSRSGSYRDKFTLVTAEAIEAIKKHKAEHFSDAGYQIWIYRLFQKKI